MSSQAVPNPVNRARSLHQLAEEWGISPRTAKRLVDAGKLKAYRIGRQLRVFEGDVREYLSKHATSQENR